MVLIPHRLRIVTGLIPWAFAFLILAGCEAGPRTESLPVTSAPVVAPAPKINDGESLPDYKARIKRDADAAIAYARQLAESEATIAIAKAQADARVAAEQAKADARTDFLDGVKTWTGWSMAALALIGVAALVLSFLPWTTAWGFDAGDSAKAFGAVAALSIGRYILLRYGLLVGDIAAWVLIAALIASAVVVAVMVGKALIRSKLFTQAKVLEVKGHTSEAVALLATAKGKTGEGVLDKQWRKTKAKGVTT